MYNRLTDEQKAIRRMIAMVEADVVDAIGQLQRVDHPVHWLFEADSLVVVAAVVGDVPAVGQRVVAACGDCPVV